MSDLERKRIAIDQIVPGDMGQPRELAIETAVASWERPASSATAYWSAIVRSCCGPARRSTRPQPQKHETGDGNQGIAAIVMERGHEDAVMVPDHERARPLMTMLPAA